MKDYGVVLAGGGTRGSYEVGVWRALKELKTPLAAVVGTSIGAINGAMMVQGDYEAAYDLWTNIDIKKVISLEGLDLSKRKKLGIREFAVYLRRIIKSGGLDISPLKKMLQECIDEERIRRSPIDYGLVTFSLTDMKPVMVYKNDIPEGKILDYIIASAALPIFQNYEIDNKRFIDGGAYDNRPVSLIAKKGIKNAIVVDVSGYGRVRRFTCDEMNIVFIKNSQRLGGILEFDSELARRNMRVGYLDALRAFKRLGGKKYYINIGVGEKSVLASPLKNAEMDSLLSVLEIDDESGLADKVISYRLIRQLSKYTDGKLDMESVVRAACEITAESFELDRLKVYSLDQLAEEILTQHLKIRQTGIFKDTLGIVRESIAGKRSLDLRDIDERYIASFYVCNDIDSSNTKKYIRLLAALSPKTCISSLFISLMMWRRGKACALWE